MDPADALATFAAPSVAVAAAAAFVLRDAVAFDRAKAPPPEPRVAVRPEPAAVRPEAPVTSVRPVVAAPEPPAPGDGSILSTLTVTDEDDSSAWRRVVSLLVLLTLTLLAAGMIGLGIYRGLSGLG